LLTQHFPKAKWQDGKIWKPKVNLVRYADDFIITGVSKELLVNEVRPLVERFLNERGLTLSADKTRITHINEGFDFLGQNLRKYDGKPLAKPSKKNTHAFLEKVRGIIDANQSVSQTLLIGLLNPVIRGWANYHQHGAAKETFNRADHEIWRALWQWARRQHPKKSRDWVKRHYFPALRNRTWMFAAKTGQQMPDGQPIWRCLVYAGETKIRRHVKIRRDANPFDPQWKSYFVERAFHKKFGIHRQEAGIKPL
jgi:RNA-directed DNA polymerase